MITGKILRKVLGLFTVDWLKSVTSVDYMRLVAELQLWRNCSLPNVNHIRTPDRGT